jgi:hypothetical protein
MLTLGIKLPKRLFIIHRDCYPTSKEWIQQMSSQFTSKVVCSVGYGRMASPTHFFKLIRFETLLTAMVRTFHGQAGHPHMEVRGGLHKK